MGTTFRPLAGLGSDAALHLDPMCALSRIALCVVGWRHVEVQCFEQSPARVPYLMQLSLLNEQQ